MQTVSPQMAAFIRANIKTPTVYVKVQLPSADGSRVNSQFILSNVTSMKLTKNQDASADTCGISIIDDAGDYSPINPTSKYGAAFAPGVIDTKFIIYTGFRSN
jgi:hypothetical protein